jgi:two-component sensor histidine kinase
MIGKTWVSLWPDAEAGKITAALDSARAGKASRFEAFCPTPEGTPKWWDVLVAPIDSTLLEPGLQGWSSLSEAYGSDRDATRLLAISRDITDRMDAEARKDALLEVQSLLLQEIHHRVKNSLQMVQNLLSLQARESHDEVTAQQLAESASRVRTISAVHDRLYKFGSTLNVEIGPYLEGLVEDLEHGMASTFQERQVLLDADRAVWPAAAVPKLGLIMTELVTNALKYGSGTIRITFRQTGHQSGDDYATLTVEDEGEHLSGNFDPAHCTGLGMRLVNGLLRPHGTLTLDRSAATTRFVAKLPRPRPRE